MTYLVHKGTDSLLNMTRGGGQTVLQRAVAILGFSVQALGCISTSSFYTIQFVKGCKVC